MTKRSTCFPMFGLGVCMMLALTSCGGSHVASGGGESSNPILQNDTVEGKYRVQLIPLNSSVSGYALVSGKIKIENDQFSVHLNAKATPENSIHVAAIYNAESCPNESHDTNNDGFIDPVESVSAIGEALIPLDGDLNSQSAGSGIYPYADTMGAYTYEQTGIFSSMLLDLKNQVLDPNDQVTKLNVGENLKLEGKVLVIHGVKDETYIPGSIRSLGHLSEQVTLPIACGKIERDYTIDNSEQL